MTKSEEIAKLVDVFSSKDEAFDGDFLQFVKQEQEDAIAKGREDGTQNTPGEHETGLTPVEQGILSSFQAKLSEYEGLVRPYLAELRDKYIVSFQQRLKDLNPKEMEQEAHQLRKEKNEKLEDAKKIRDAKIDALKDQSSFHIAKENFQDLRAKFEGVKLTLNRNYTDSHVPFWFYGLVFVIVAIGEIFVNYQVFEFFGESKILTWFSVISLGLILAFTAHGVGKLLKKYSLKNKLVWVYLVFFLICVAVMAFSISSLRSHYISDIMDDSSSIVASSRLLFIALSFIFFLVGVFFSWLYYDSSSEFLAIKKDFEQAKSVYESERRKMDSQKENIHQAYQQEASKINDDYENLLYNVEDEDEILKNLIQIALAQYNAILHEAKATERLINAAFKETISDYRNENKRIRPRDKMPSNWSTLPSLELIFVDEPFATNLSNNNINLN